MRLIPNQFRQQLPLTTAPIYLYYFSKNSSTLFYFLSTNQKRNSFESWKQNRGYMYFMFSWILIQKHWGSLRSADKQCTCILHIWQKIISFFLDFLKMIKNNILARSNYLKLIINTGFTIIINRNIINIFLILKYYTVKHRYHNSMGLVKNLNDIRVFEISRVNYLV